MTKRASFEAIQDYVESFINYAPVDGAQNIVLVGNKTDLASNRQVGQAEATALARDLGLAAALETSALDVS